MKFDNRLILGLIMAGCALSAVSTYASDMVFRNTTERDVVIKFASHPTYGDKGIIVKAGESMRLALGGPKKRNRAFDYAYVIPEKTPSQMEKTKFFTLMKEAGIDYKDAVDIIFTDSDKDWAPRAYAVLRGFEPFKATPGASKTSRPAYDAGDRKAAAQAQAESEVSRSAGSAASAASSRE